MKRRKIAAISFFIIIFFLVGCKLQESPYTTIDDKLVLSDYSNTFCLYSDDNDMLFALYNDNGEIMTLETESFIRYDLEGNIKKIYEVNSDRPIYQVVPFNEGIIYVETKVVAEQLEWSVIYLDDDSKDIRMSGIGDSPTLTALGESVMIVWKDLTQKASGVSVISESGIENIVKETYDWILNTGAKTNFKEICFPIVEKGELKMAVVDTAGIVTKAKLEGKIMDFALTKEYLICNLEAENDIADNILTYKMLFYDIKKNEAEYTTMPDPRYRMEGGDSDTAVCVDVSYNIFEINGKTKEEKKLHATQGNVGTPVVFSPEFKGKRIVRFENEGVESYYIKE